MAISEAAASSSIAGAPTWPVESVDPGIAWIDYDVVADEFLVYFGGRPVPAISSLLDGPGFEDVAIMIGLDHDGRQTGEIVGVHVIPMLLGAVQDKPAWAVLAWAAMAGDWGAELLRDRLPGFLDEVHAAFERYWTPPLSIEEQLAHIAQARREKTPPENET
jgi:hypothetical protein